MIKISDWKTTELPTQKDDLGLSRYLWGDDAEKVLAGFKPQDMNQRGQTPLILPLVRVLINIG